jgi:hypothetical protein
MLLLDEDVDDIRNGTPNHNVFLYSFAMHEIGPGLYPQVSTELFITDSLLGNANSIYEPGESIVIFPKIKNHATMPLSRIYSPRCSLATDNEHVSFPVSVSVAGDIKSDTCSYGSPMMMEISPFAPSMFVKIFIFTSCSNSDKISKDSIYVSVGYPSILLVDDSGFDTYSVFYEESLFKVPALWRTVNTLYDSINISLLDSFDVVIWFTGNAESPLTEREKSILEEYYSNGGSILLSGQNIAKQNQSTDFLSSFIGARYER